MYNVEVFRFVGVPGQPGHWEWQVVATYKSRAQALWEAKRLQTGRKHPAPATDEAG